MREKSHGCENPLASGCFRRCDLVAEPVPARLGASPPKQEMDDRYKTRRSGD